MQKRLEFQIGTERLAGNIRLPDNPAEPSPCVITSHGYKSHSGSEKYLRIAQHFSRKGIAVFRFDHRGALNGESDGDFQYTTLSRRTEDVKAAVEALHGVSEIDSSRLGLLGSSLGGMDILMLKSDRVKAIVIMSTPFAFPPPSDEMKTAFREKGYYDYSDGTRIKKDFYEDVLRHNLQKEVKQIKCPLLIIHAYLDELVPRHHAEVLYRSADSAVKELIMVDGGDHAFTDSKQLKKVIGYALNWFRKYL